MTRVSLAHQDIFGRLGKRLKFRKGPGALRINGLIVARQRKLPLAV